MEWVVYWFSGLAIFQVLEYLGKLSVVGGVILFIVEAPERRDHAISDAWLVLNAANQSDGTAGRYSAIQYLAKVGSSLEGVRLNRADLSGINLKGANLQDAYLNRVVFRSANLTNADLSGADLQNVVFAAAKLQGAKFINARMFCADFRGAKSIEPNQVKQGKEWELAVYDDAFRKRLGVGSMTNLPDPSRPGKNYYCPYP